MKVYFKNGKMVAEAESLRDVEALLSLNGGGVKHRKHKKHLFMKPCWKCGKKFKGAKGLGKHMSHCKVEVDAV